MTTLNELKRQVTNKIRIDPEAEAVNHSREIQDKVKGG